MSIRTERHAQTPAQDSPRIVVFLGPSLPHAEARRILDADFRPPVRRGDLAAIPAGTVVGIIDGVFDQNLAVSPREIREAALRGVALLGASSMGALRATEVREMEGVGRVHAMFRDGTIEDDDEVALVFDPDSLTPLSEPMVNIRHAVAALVRPGTIHAATGQNLLRTAKKLHYAERSYLRILSEMGMGSGPEARQLATMLRSYDLKREDAISLLEKLPTVQAPAPRLAVVSDGSDGLDQLAREKPLSRYPADAPVYFWEFGDRVPFAELVIFLKMTDAFEPLARAAIARFALAGNHLGAPPVPQPPELRRDRDDAIMQLRRQWDWNSGEEVSVSLKEMGLGRQDVEERVVEEVLARRAVAAVVREGSEAFLRALRVELFMNDLALKRAALRCGSLAWFAERARQAGMQPTADSLAAARKRICELLLAASWSDALTQVGVWGVSAAEAEQFAERLALASQSGAPVAQALAGTSPSKATASSIKTPGGSALRFRPSPKVQGDRRFCLPLSRAKAAIKQLRKAVGITRVSMITGLHPIALPNAQAFRPDGSFSSTIGSGKSMSVLGAKIGAVMEEVEKWAQEKFPAAGAPPEKIATFAALRARRVRVLDPRSLDLPHDSPYREDLELGWRPCADVLSGEEVLVPSAAMQWSRVRNDIFYSPRLGHKVFSTSGLASGFTLEEATLHAVCELVERHAIRLAELRMGNPGTPEPFPYHFIDLDTLPRSSQKLVAKIRKAGHRVNILEITSEIRVPTMWAAIDGTWATGFGSHPDPEVAINQAVLEAAQAVFTAVAGAREHLTLRSRSLGRHERTRAATRAGRLLFAQSSPPSRPFSRSGFESADALLDLRWVAARLRDAGFERLLIVDYSQPAIQPARVVRAILPGVETPSPFHAGPRVRAVLLRDLLPGR